MRSPSGEIILGGETMRFWDLRAPWIEPCRSPSGLDVRKLKSNITTTVARTPGFRVHDTCSARLVELRWRCSYRDERHQLRLAEELALNFPLLLGLLRGTAGIAVEVESTVELSSLERTFNYG